VGALLVVEWLFGDTLVTFASQLFAGLAALPRWMVVVVVTGSRLLAAGLLVCGLVALVRGHRWRPVVPLVVAGLGAAGLILALDAFDPEPGQRSLDLPSVLVRSFPTAAGLAAVTAVVTAAAPWLARGWRRAGWLAVFGLAVTRFVATPASFEAVAAVLVGWLAGAAAVVVFGGPWRRPRGRAVVAGMADAGVPLVRLEQAQVDARGSTPYFGYDADGTRLFVKVLGDDERSADRLFRLYRRVLPRDLGDERPFSSLRRAVEHEALVALAAGAAGVRTPRLVTLARAEPNGFVLAYEAIDGRSLDRATAEEMTDELLAALWEQVRNLRAHGIAHRDLRLANLFLDARGMVWIIDFGFSELAASELLLVTDVAEVVASSASRVGADRSVAAASAAIGPGAVRAASARLRPWALSGATRRALADEPGLLDEIRRRVEDLRVAEPVRAP
jgi:undecaprenyl-diphosphatase